MTLPQRYRLAYVLVRTTDNEPLAYATTYECLKRMAEEQEFENIMIVKRDTKRGLRC